MQEMFISLANSLARKLENFPAVPALEEDVPKPLLKKHKEGWEIMVSMRPLMGAESKMGEAVRGRHWVALDPDDPSIDEQIKNNRKMDARVVFFTSKDNLSRMALVGNKYVKEYMDMDIDQRYDLTRNRIDKIEGMKYKDVRALYHRGGHL